MKLNRLLLMSVMGLGLFACNNNDLVEGTSGQDSTQSEGTTYMAFTIDFSEMGTRTEPTSGSLSGTTEESNITTAAVVMADNGTIESVVTNAESNKYIFETTPGEHTFYAIVNYDEAPTKGQSIADYFQTAQGFEVSELTTDNNFMMSSVEKSPFTIKDNITKNQALEGTDSNTNNFTIKVERVAAKITMTCSNTTLQDAGEKASGVISEAKFNLYNVATYTYRMRSSTIYENTDFVDGASGVDVCTEISGDNTSLTASATPAYCLENLQANYLQGNTTYVNLSTIFKPSKAVVCDDDLSTTTDIVNLGADDDKTFRVVTAGSLNGNYIMEKDLRTYQHLEEGLPVKTDEASLPEGVDAVSAPYTNGQCWFGPIWVGETSKDAAPINRNYWYNLNITGIELPGEPQEPTITEEEEELPLYPNTNVAITLQVMPWTFVNRDIDL